MQIEQPEDQRAYVDILLKESIIQQTTIISESEGPYEKQEASCKSADTSFTCLPTTSQSEVTIQESEIELIPENQPTKHSASSRYPEQESVTIEEIETGDLPQEFKDTFKVSSDNAFTKIELAEATHITETYTGESETSYEQPQFTTYNVETSLVKPQEQVEIVESQILEKERDLDNFELPESHKGKPGTLQLLPTGITEETLVEHSTDLLKPDRIEEGKADYTHTLQTEITTSETLVNEDVAAVETKDTETKQATSVLSPQEALNVNVVLADDKEKPYTPAESLPEKYATTAISTKKVASKSTVEAGYGVGNLEVDMPQEVTAISDQDTMESIQVTEHEIAEAEYEHKEVKPETKIAALNLTETLAGVHTSQIITHEKEDTYEMPVKPLEATATSDLTSQEVVVRSEHETVTHAEDIQEEAPQTGKAKKFTKPFTELEVTETNVVEVEKILKDTVFPDKKQAAVDILPGQALSVTETITDDKEDKLHIPDVSSSTADINIGGQKVALKEEIMADSLPGQLSIASPEQHTASSSQDLSLALQQTQYIVGEKETEKPAEIKPDEKYVNIDISELQSLNIVEVTTDDKEKDLSERKLPEMATGTTTVLTQIPATTTEVSADDSVAEFEKTAVDSQKAKPDYMPVDSFLVSEQTAFEIENQFSDIKPEQKSAQSEYEEATSLSITDVTPAIKESPLSIEAPETKSATTELVPQNTVEIGETVPVDAVKDYQEVQPTKALATTSQSEHQSIVSTVAITGETEFSIPDSEKPLQHTVDIQFEDILSVQVSEAITSEKESEYESIVTLPEKNATATYISQQIIAETNITFAHDTTSDVKKDEPLLVKALVDQTTVEGISESQPFVEEKETTFDRLPEQTQTAGASVLEDQSISVTYVTSNENEIPLTLPEKPIGKEATFDVETRETSLNMEVRVSDNVEPMEVEAPALISPLTDITPLNAIVNLETITSDAVADKPTSDKPSTKQAIVSFGEVESVTVETVLTEDKEKEFERKPHDTASAATTMTDAQAVATQLESQTQDTIGDIDIVQPSETVANKAAIPFDSAVVSEQTVVDQESELTETDKKSIASANVNYESAESIITTEAVTAQTEQKLDDLQLPAAQKAIPLLDINRKIAELNIPLTSENIDIFKAHIPETYTAKEAEEVLNSLIVSQDIPEETGTSFEGKFEPYKSTANVLLEHKNQSVGVKEVIIQEKEGSIEDMIKPIQQKASSDFDTITVPEQTQIITQDSLMDKTESSAPTSVAVVKQIPFNEILQTQHQIQDKEEILKLAPISDEKKAEASFEGTNVVSTFEVVPADNESILSAEKSPATSSAQISVSQNISSEITEILASIEAEELSVEKSATVRAETEQDVVESLTHTIPTVMESTSNLASEKQPNLTTAEPKVDALPGLCIKETYSEATVNEFFKQPQKEESATPSFDASKALEQSEVHTSENIADLRTDEQKIASANLKTDALEPLESTELIIHEAGKSIEEKFEADTQQATEEISEVTSITVQEVYSEQKETTLIAEKPEQKTSTPTVLENIPLAQTVVVSQDSLEKFDAPAQNVEKAETSQTGFESLTVSVKNVQETEVPFEDKVLESKTASVLFTTKDHFGISEIISNELETDFSRKDTPTAIAAATVSPVEAAQIEETRTEQDLGTFTQEETDTIQASELHIPYQIVNITETVSTESENVLKPEIKPDESSASLILEEPGKTASISETATREDEVNLRIPAPTLGSATPLIDEQRSVLKKTSQFWRVYQNFNLKNWICLEKLPPKLIRSKASLQWM